MSHRGRAWHGQQACRSCPPRSNQPALISKTARLKLICAMLGRFWGYEISTEGDSFLLAFHDPADAVEWAVTTQQALLSAAWPRQLERHDNTCIRLTPQAQGVILGTSSNPGLWLALQRPAWPPDPPLQNHSSSEVQTAPSTTLVNVACIVYSATTLAAPTQSCVAGLLPALIVEMLSSSAE